MNCVRIAAAALVGALLPPSAALADWTYSRWGMSPAEVVKASRGKATVVAPLRKDNIGLLERLVVADYSTGGRAYQAQFYFRAVGGLELVRLEPKDPTACSAIKAELVAKYGPPKDPMFPRWWDGATANAVRFNELPRNLCYVVHGK